MTLNNSLLECVDQFGDRLDQLEQSEVTSPGEYGGGGESRIGAFNQERENEEDMLQQQIVPMNQHISYINH